MTEQELHDALDRIIHNTADASDPAFLLKFLMHNLPEDAYGSFEYIPTDPYKDEESSRPFPSECRIQSASPVTRDQYNNCQTLSQLADEMAEILDTAWTEEKTKPSTGLDHIIYFREEVPF